MYTESDKIIRKFIIENKLETKERDIFISERINKTLKENEREVLFIGISHHADVYLEKIQNIKIIEYKHITPLFKALYLTEKILPNINDKYSKIRLEKNLNNIKNIKNKYKSNN